MTSPSRRILLGRNASYQLLHVLKEPSVFKAKIVSSERPSLPLSNGTPPLVTVKNLIRERELRAHQVPELRACPYVRQLLDVVEPVEDEPKKLVLEWMEATLWQIRPHGKLANPKLPQIVAKSILEALVVFQRLHAVHTDVNPNNIFLTFGDLTTPIVKLGDLDNAFHEGIAKDNPNAQTHETRAPEVWQGLGVWHSSDMWSLGVTLVHWLMSRTLFGPQDKIIEDHRAAWCLAKITRLIGPMEIPNDPRYEDEFALAQELAVSHYEDPQTGESKPFIALGSLRHELQQLPRDVCSHACIDFLEYLLVIDPAKRPTAEEALQHPFITTLSS